MAKGSQKTEILKKPTYQVVEWEGKKYKLAIVQKGKNIPEVDKIRIADLVCKMYAENKYTLMSCLQKCGVFSDSTWYSWRENVREIEELFQEAEQKKAEKRSYQLRELATTQLEKRITGEIIELTETIGEPVTDESGEVLFIKTTAIKKRQVYVKPSDQLIALTLVNTDPRNFERSPKAIERMNKEVDIDPIEWVD